MTLVALFFTLLGCPQSGEGHYDQCQTDAPLEDAELPCSCGEEDPIFETPDCGTVSCTATGFEYDDAGCDTGGCKGVDCG